MKGTKVLKAVYILAAVIQIALVAAVFQVSDLTTKKAGVMHHVYYMKDKYAQGLYSTANLKLQSALILVIALLCTGLLAWAVVCKKSAFLQAQACVAASMGVIAWYVINGGFFKGLLAYPYFIMAIELVLIIQILVLTATAVFEKRKKINS